MRRTLFPARLLLLLSAALPAPFASLYAQGFVERALEAGLLHEHLAGYDLIGVTGNIAMNDWVQSGVALGDLDGDGDLDVVVCGGVLRNHVFLGDGRGSFTDASAAAGIDVNEFDRVPALGDYDDDGDLDLFLGALDAGDGPRPGHSRLYRNDGAGRFEEVTALSGTVGAGHTAHAKWADVDRDGLLDLYTGEFHGTPNRLYLNHGDGTFAQAAELLGVDDTGSAHVVAAVDANEDGLLDLFTANDYAISFATQLSANARDAHLSGVPSGLFCDVSADAAFEGNTTMGLAFGDVDYDGRLDVYKTEYGSNFLLLNSGWPESGIPWNAEQDYYRVANATLPGETGAGRIPWAVGWGTTFAHLDLDPWLDLIVINGHAVEDDPRDQRNFLFRGLGPAAGHRFTDAAPEYGFLDHVDDRGLAVGDVDADGDLDLFVTPIEGPLRFYENRLERGGQGWIRVRAVTRTSAPGAHGVRVEWTDSLGLPHVRVIGSESPTASQNAHEAFFGLGEEPVADVVVHFPSGVTRTFAGTPANTFLVAEEPELVRLEQRTISAELAGAAFRVTAFAHDAAGAALGPDATVTIDMSGLVALGPVAHVQGNEFRRSFRVPDGTGSFRARVAFDGFEVRVRPRLRVTGRPLAAASSLALVPECTRAGSDERIRVIVALRDARGSSAGPGHAVAVGMQGAVIPLSDLGDGRYAGELSAPPLPGRHDLALVLSGATFPAFAALESAGPARPETTTVYREVPDPGIAASPHQLRLLVTPRDELGLRLGPGAALVVHLHPAPGSQPVSVVEGARGSQRDGDHYVILARAPESDPHSARGTFEIEVDGRLVAGGAYSF